MIKSMTGYGRGEHTEGQRTASVEIRSVNHRYCEVSTRLPGRYAFAEDAVKQLVKRAAGRGKIDVTINFVSADEADAPVSLNMAVARQYFMSLREMQKAFDTTGEITIELLASMPDVLRQERPQSGESAILEIILAATDGALKAFDEMRASEGAKLTADIKKRLAALQIVIEAIAARAPEVRDNHAARLRERIAILLDKPEDITMREQRLALEIAVFADKASIDEEIVRLSSHIEQFYKAIEKGDGAEPIGKKLDFLVQEMNREANTIASKANDLRITDSMIELKNEIENIREQIQNIC